MAGGNISIVAVVQCGLRSQLIVYNVFLDNLKGSLSHILERFKYGVDKDLCTICLIFGPINTLFGPINTLLLVNMQLLRLEDQEDMT